MILKLFVVVFDISELKMGENKIIITSRRMIRLIRCSSLYEVFNLSLVIMYGDISRVVYTITDFPQPPATLCDDCYDSDSSDDSSSFSCSDSSDDSGSFSCSDSSNSSDDCSGCYCCSYSSGSSDSSYSSYDSCSSCCSYSSVSSDDSSSCCSDCSDDF